MAPKHKGPAASPNAKSSASKGKQVALKAKAGGVKKKKSTICGISGSASMVADDHILLGSCETTLSRDVVSGKFISTQVGFYINLSSCPDATSQTVFSRHSFNGDSHVQRSHPSRL